MWVKERMARTVQEREKRGIGLDVIVGEDGDGNPRALTQAERALLRDGKMDEMELEVAEAAVAVFIRQGAGFLINTPQ